LFVCVCFCKLKNKVFQKRKRKRFFKDISAFTHQGYIKFVMTIKIFAANSILNKRCGFSAQSFSILVIIRNVL